MKSISLGSFEEIVLLTVATLHDEAYGVIIRQEIESRLSKKVSISALQTSLRRLEDKGYLESEFGEATAIRGGKRKRYFKITAYGIKALKTTKEVRLQLWNSIPQYLLEFK